MTPLEQLRHALQRMLDEEGDGWQLSQHVVVVVGLERVNSGGIESTAWSFWPDGQADYITTGLLDTAMDQRSCVGGLDD